MNVRAALDRFIGPVIAVLLDELEAEYAYSSLPLPAKQLEAFDLARQLLIQCSYAYKMLVLEKTGKMIVFNAKKNLPGPMYWSMFYLRELMMQSYKTYYPVPAGRVAGISSALSICRRSRSFLTEIGDTRDHVERCATCTRRDDGFAG